MASASDKASDRQAGQEKSGFSEQKLWQKLRDGATIAGREVVEKVLVLFFTAQRPETPLWAKTVIYSALAYFILPTDLLPDFIPVTGYADDLTTLLAALGTVTMCITPEVQEAAKQKVTDWFGEMRALENEESVASESSGVREIAID